MKTTIHLTIDDLRDIAKIYIATRYCKNIADIGIGDSENLHPKLITTTEGKPRTIFRVSFKEKI